MKRGCINGDLERSCACRERRNGSGGRQSLLPARHHQHWTGFYRAVSEDLLIVGPYQGGHGCLRITFDRGVCGAAARTRQTQLISDVEAFPGHIACSATTRSEIVVPIVTPDDRLLAVLDVDSDDPDAFDETDQHFLETLCQQLGVQFRAA